MDKETQKKLSKMNHEVAQKYKHQLFVTKDNKSNDRSRLEDYSKDKRMSRKERDKAKTILNNPSWKMMEDKNEKVVNEKVASKLRAEVEQKTKDMIKRGDIKPAERDDFIKRLEK